METNQVKFEARTYVTARAANTYKNFGLTDFDPQKFTNAYAEVVSDPEKLKEIATHCFVGDWKDKNFDTLEFDPENLWDAICFFGKHAFKIVRGQAKPTGGSSPKK